MGCTQSSQKICQTVNPKANRQQLQWNFQGQMSLDRSVTSNIYERHERERESQSQNYITSKTGQKNNVSCRCQIPNLHMGLAPNPIFSPLLPPPAVMCATGQPVVWRRLTYP